jgi:hypothetical protein
MVIYPVPAAITQAKMQLVIDVAAKARPQGINADVLNLAAAVSQAQRDALLDRKA